MVIVGDSAFAEVAYEYFTHDSDMQVVGFVVEREYLKRTELFDLPVVALEDVDSHFAPAEHDFFAALVYTQLNRLRTRLYRSMKNKGYKAASYISSRAFVWPNVKVGEHCFVFEDNTVQPFSVIGNNVVLWSGNHIGHHSIIRDNCFISSHVVVSGFCDIGENCFMGVNSSIGNNVTVGADCLIGAGALVTKNLEVDSVVRGPACPPAANAKRLCKVPANPVDA
jgi:sugar O-acyltransferase (sialic acid O-acetyltransferase NeuD family)